MLPSRSPQRCATLFRQGVGDAPAIALIDRHAPRCAIEYGTCVRRPISAEASYLDRQSVIQFSRDGTAHDSDAAQFPIVVMRGVPPERPDRDGMMPVMHADSSRRG